MWGLTVSNFDRIPITTLTLTKTIMIVDLSMEIEEKGRERKDQEMKKWSILIQFYDSEEDSMRTVCQRKIKFLN